MLALVCLVAVVAAGCGAVAHMTVTSADTSVGKKGFTNLCSSCHTLAADNASGVVGPNLDYAFGPDRCQGFSESTIADVVRGQIAYADSDPDTDWPPNSTNPVPGMPANLATGTEAKDIAAYVATVAGLTTGPGKHFDCQTGAYAG